MSGLHSTVLSTIPDAALARRAIGAMFYLGFGGAWIEYFVYRSWGLRSIAFFAVALVTGALLLFAYRRYKINRPAPANEISSPNQKTSDRIFHLINAGQWIVILVAGNVLANLGFADWVIPCAIFVVGLHFLPLGRLFKYRPHYATGVALMALAAAYPFVASHGPSSPIGCLGAGLILWASAGWSLRGKQTVGNPT